MADKYKVVIKSSCNSYRKPNLGSNTNIHMYTGFQYTNCIKVPIKETDKKTKKTNTIIWYKVAEDVYVQGKYCKATKTHDDPNDPKPKKNDKKNKKNDKNKKTSGEKVKNQKELDKQIKNMVKNKQKELESRIDGSMRLYGLPHQLTEKNDYRISSKTNLGTMFTETFILEAPILYIKPGTTEFLPGMSQAKKANFVNAILQAATTNGKSVAQELSTMTNKDWRYFDFKSKFSEYSRNTKMLCCIGSVLLGLNKIQVPWVTDKKVTFGSYDWADYRFSAVYDISKTKYSGAKGVSGKDFVALIKKTVTNALKDDSYLCFYIDAAGGASESASNSTTQSIINQYTDSLTAVGNELSFVSGVTGLKIDKLVQSTAQTIDKTANEIAKGDGQIATFLHRLTGTTNQLLRGDNFIAPEIYNDSSYSKSYNFSITLATPYGCKEAWFYNIYIPLIHILTLALPIQTTANTTSSPFLIKAFSPGTFSCDLGLIDSVSIEKGGSGDAWTADGMAAEMKISVTIKDLYATLALPDNYSFKTFFSNTGLIDFLMVNCGINLTSQIMDDKIRMMVNLFKNNISSLVTTFVDDKIEGFKEQIRNAFSLWL